MIILYCIPLGGTNPLCTGKLREYFFHKSLFWGELLEGLQYFLFAALDRCFAALFFIFAALLFSNDLKKIIIIRRPVDIILWSSYFYTQKKLKHGGGTNWNQSNYSTHFPRAGGPREVLQRA